MIHHSAGILTVVPVLLNGMHMNRHVQKGGAALLLAGGISLVVLVVARTRDRRIASHARQSAYLWVGNWTFYMYCRFNVFSGSMLALYREEYSGMSTVEKRTFTCFVAILSSFNVLIALDVSQTTVSRIAEAWKMTMSESKKKQ